MACRREYHAPARGSWQWSAVNTPSGMLGWKWNLDITKRQVTVTVQHPGAGLILRFSFNKGISNIDFCISDALLQHYRNGKPQNLNSI